MGLTSLSIVRPPPAADIAHNGLPAAFYVHTLNPDRLLRLCTIFLEGVHLRQIRPAEARHGPFEGFMDLIA